MTGSTTPTQLPRAAIERKAALIFSVERQRLAAVLEGTGEAGEIQVGDQVIEIVPTSCELQLRRELSQREGRGRPAIYLADWLPTPVLPLDLRARMAEGKLYRIGREERLRQVFRCKRVGRDLRSSALAKLALEGAIDEFPSAPHLTLNLQLAAFTWLSRVLREGAISRTAPTEEQIVGACLASQGGEIGVKGAEDQVWHQVRDEVADALENGVSSLAAVAFAAWTADQTRHVLPVLHLLEGLEAGKPDDYQRSLVHKEIRHRYPEWAERASALRFEGNEALVDSWKPLCDDRPDAVSQYVDELIEAIGHPELFAGSPRMVVGLEHREVAAGKALSAMVANRQKAKDDSLWDQVQKTIAELLQHRRTADDREWISMVRRLAAWLWGRRRGPAVPAGPPIQAAMHIARDFAADGGFVDWARRVVKCRARRGPFGAGVDALLKAVETARDQQERAFAEGMCAWAEAGRPAEGCLPIERTSRELVAGFLKRSEGRRLLVLLMDGMSWGRCRELSADLERLGWQSLRWRPEGFAGKPIPPVLAAFPTITPVSRAAFFAGSVPEPGKSPSTGKDPDRWRKNPSVREFATTRGQLELFLRDRVELPDGHAHQDVVTATRDLQEPLVAAVINTIDDAIKGTPSLDFDADLQAIKPLAEILDAARAARRAVLLIADHGHVIGDRTARVPGGREDGGARWRALGNTPPASNEIVLQGRGTWSPVADEPVVVLAGETDRYSVHDAHGEHGGLSLAEVVSPAWLIGTADIAGRTGEATDGDLEPDASATPEWWSADEWRPSGRREPAQETPTTPSLFGEPQRGTPGPPAWSGQLAKSPILAQTLRLAPIPPKDRSKVQEQALILCESLVERGDKASALVLAQALGIPVARLSGLLTRLQSVLNVDGYDCVRFERQTSTVHLDRELLANVFGVTIDS